MINASLKNVTLVFTILILFSFKAFTQGKNVKDNLDTIDLRPFADAAHHWYDITDKGTIVHAAPGQAHFKTTDLEKVGDNILLYQKDNGGWPKNYDIMAILTPEQKDSLKAAKKNLNTTFDNGTTYTHVAALAKIYTITHLDRFKKAAIKGIDFILAAQYSNGGWPQYYPLEDNYSRYITYNDGAFEGIMEVLKEAIDRKTQYLFIDTDSKVVYSLAEVDRERRDGYAWYTYAPQKVLNQYPDWQKKWIK